MISFDLDEGFRSGAFDTAIEWHINENTGIEAAFIDEGQQPDGIKNVNRIGDLDLVFHYPVSGGVELYVSGGATTSRFGYNGSGDGYKNDTWLSGGNVGAGATYNINEHWALQARATAANYQQVDKTAYETFEYVSVGLRYTF